MRFSLGQERAETAGKTEPQKTAAEVDSWGEGAQEAESTASQAERIGLRGRISQPGGGPAVRELLRGR